MTIVELQNFNLFIVIIIEDLGSLVFIRRELLWANIQCASKVLIIIFFIYVM